MPGEVADESLARRADHHGSEAREFLAAAEKLEVVVIRLSEADAGIDEDLVFGDARGHRVVAPLAQLTLFA